MLKIPLEELQQCWFLAGPTASGKSTVAMLLARYLHAEIVALDSMTLYRKMNIGTAKPSPAEQETVPHHLFDIVDPHEEFSVAEYMEAAIRSVNDILDRGRTPLFVGGTGLYLRSLLRGVFAGPDADWDFRRKMDVVVEEEGPIKLHEMLQNVDAEAAGRIHPNDVRRVIRALEVNHVTGQTLSAQHDERPLEESVRPKHIYWLSPSRPWLHDRINRRVEQMMVEGLVEEVQGLMELEPALGRTARQALGYKEIIDALEEGRPLEEAVEQIKIRTRQFAKRQHTWYRNIVECQEVTFTEDESAKEIADRLIARS
ncbi:tRNA (adenosine(37)-N6)-dimethylallyltransferase MiaA [Polystyrenella longa]|nr:tRNA (adenosine(37)-N6)-dimethylallyltransferase MiaA [Polystyrenella longa]